MQTAFTAASRPRGTATHRMEIRPMSARSHRCFRGCIRPLSWPLLLALCLATLLTGARAGAQTYLVNTGPGSSSTIGAPSLMKIGSIYQYLGVKFTLASPATIGSIEGWMARPGGFINVKLRSHDTMTNKPGAELFSTSVNGSSTVPAWAVFSGLNWAVSADTYWVTFEPVSGSGSMPNGAAAPLRSHVFQGDDSGGWQLQSGSMGLRISTPPPPADLLVPSQYATIQAAINAATTGQNVVVSPGTYAEAINFNGKAITVKSTGGAATTTINATGLNASVVSFVTGETAASTLDGFTLTGGAGTLVSGSRRGGGIYCVSSSPTIKNCVITANIVNNIGGGMRCTSSSPTLVDCTFSANTAINGGGVSNGSSSNPSFTNCSFHNNTGTVTGGAIDNAFSSPTFVGCDFTGNGSGTGGAIQNSNTCSPSFNGCTFNDNTASTGSVMYSNINCHAAFTDCEFFDNTATFAATIFIFDHSNGSYTGCLFENNDGGNFAGGIYVGLVSSPTISNCDIKNNQASNTGGGIYSEVDCNPSISGTWLCGNTPNAVFGPYANGGGNNINASCTPAGDADGDGHVNTDDLIIIITSWGPCPIPPTPCQGDLTGDDLVNTDDLLLVIGSWG